MMYKAQKQDAVSFELINLRDFGIGLNKLTMPYGGGDGMLRSEPLLLL